MTPRIAAILSALLVGTPALAQLGLGAPTSDRVVVPVVGDRLSGFVLPIAPVQSDLVMRATQAWTWQVDDTQRVLLRGDVEIRAAGNTLRSDEAVVWINRLPTAEGTVNQIAIYFDQASAPTQRAGLSPGGRDLLVTASARGEIVLRATFEEPGPPSGAAILARGEQRLGGHLRRLLVSDPELSPIPRVDRPTPPPEVVPLPGVAPPLPPPTPSAVSLPSGVEGLPLFDPTGLVTFAGRSVTIEERTDMVVIEGGFGAEYLDETSPAAPRRLTLNAERGVVYLQPGTAAGIRGGARQLRAEQVLGVYLEGDVVAHDGRYTVRGKQVYYDLRANRALVAQAVMRTYVRESGRPVVARAEEMRQLSRDEFRADQARLSTSEFFVPHLSIGAERIVLDRAPDDGRPGDVLASAEDITLRAGRTPFFWWPGVATRNADVPLRSASAGYSDRTGARIETSWDLLSLMGVEPRPEISASLEIDGYFKRGPALGSKVDYEYFGKGNLDLWGLYDEGEDRTSSGLDVDPSTKYRGLALFEHRAPIDENWTLDLQASWISDATLITSWRELDFAQRREYETSAYLLRQESNHALSVLAKYDLNGFISNEWLLGSRGYTVERMPEGAYRRYGDVLFDKLVWTQEWSASRMRILPTKGTPDRLGVPGAAFGLPGDADIPTAYLERGYRSNAVVRGDTRHEVSWPFSAGPVKLVPFGVGRLTGYYNDDFEAFSSDAEDFRWFGAAGVRASTQFQRVDNTVENRLLDIHRMRTILEPGAMAWYGYTNVPDGAYPVYDEWVESIDGTAAFALNLKTTLQTQRGGPGRWKSVDWLVLDIGGVMNSSDANVESPIPEFYRYRPEYSHFGDHVYGTARWQITDALAFAGMSTWDVENDVFARGSVGLEMLHSPDFLTYVEYRTIESEDSELIEVGLDYKIGRKYRLLVAPQIDLVNGGFRGANIALVRALPDFEFVLSVGYDDIAQETNFSAQLRPLGF